jgi:hypothetical protein
MLDLVADTERERNDERRKNEKLRELLYLSLQKDARVRRDVCRTGRARSSPILGGLHHQYVRV